MASLARMALARPLAAPAARAFSTIPVTNVARIMRCHAGNEENAVKLDEMVRSNISEFKKQPGYVKTVRTVCKAEWAYEVEIRFDSLENFRAYMDSDFRKNTVLPMLEKMKPHMTDADKVYSGNRVIDDM
eukprot:SRR837773.11502.p2 GENE.SRR837773.11502~~SRR837773.11502.p2  ORF type:complete len:139 (-),score=53.88 SRR837773.11502:72-461(-)